MLKEQENKPVSNWRHRLYEIIFEAETGPGKAFDLILLIAIVISVLAVLLESVKSIDTKYGSELYTIEWVFTILFSLEYIARIIVSKKPAKYIFSFLGLIDFLSILPTYLSLMIEGSQALLIIRTIRLLRVFRILKLARYLTEGVTLMEAMKASRFKIIVFLGAVTTSVLILGSLMYLIEGEKNGFTSIPKSIYWAVVTLTTVGYGDIAPQTFWGQALATLIMIMGYGIIAVPTGIVTSELSNQKRSRLKELYCHKCRKEGHDQDAEFCKYCGDKL